MTHDQETVFVCAGRKFSHTILIFSFVVDSTNTGKTRTASYEVDFGVHQSIVSQMPSTIYI